MLDVMPAFWRTIDLKARTYNKFIIFNSFAVMIVERRNEEVLEVLVDIDDVDLLKNHATKWFAVPDEAGKMYIKDGNSLGIHRFVTKAEKGEVVDHLNHNTLDNRKCI